MKDKAEEELVDKAPILEPVPTKEIVTPDKVGTYI